jgi:hypothetical protein
MRRFVLTILAGAAVVAAGCTSKRDSPASSDRPSGAAAAAVPEKAPIHKQTDGARRILGRT